jgi:hypothetical protein
MTDKLGPTGDFPLGKLSRDDEGELRVKVSHEDGVVRIDFGAPTAWIGLPPDHALAFAAVVVKHAMALKGSI